MSGLIAELQKTSLLRHQYESIAGSVGDRQWRRICERLAIFDEDDWSAAPIVRTYAEMRKSFPRSRITCGDVRDYRYFRGVVPTGGCNGADLEHSIGLILHPTPDRRTLYNWGKAIGISFRVKRWYTAEEVGLWLDFVLKQPRFEVGCKFIRSQHGKVA